METWKIYRKRLIEKPILLRDLQSFNKPRIPFRQEEDLSLLTRREQEKRLINDLRKIFTGFEGNIIGYELVDNEVEWTINSSVDGDLHSKLFFDGCLPLAAYVILIRAKISKLTIDLSRGKIILSITDFISDFIFKNIDSFILNLEISCENENENVDPVLNLFNFSSRMQSFEERIKFFNELLTKIIVDDLVGGEVFRLIDELSSFASFVVENICKEIEKVALREFYRLLLSWINHGTLLCDGAYEFFIWDLDRAKKFSVKEITNNERSLIGEQFQAFVERFCVIQDLAPPQFLICLKDIVMCGVYSILIRQIAQNELQERASVEKNDITSLSFLHSDDVIRYIKDLRIDISRQLLIYLRGKYSLDEIFDLIRRFIFIDSCEFHITFLESAAHFLESNIEDLSMIRFNNAFQEAIDKSTFANNRNVEIFSAQIENDDIFDLLSKLSEQSASSNEFEEEYDSKEEILVSHRFGIKFNFNSFLLIAFDANFLSTCRIFFRVMFLMNRAYHMLALKCSQIDLSGEERYILEHMLHKVKVYLSHCSYYALPQLCDEFFERFNSAHDLESLFEQQFLFFTKLMLDCFLLDAEFMSIVSSMLHRISDFVEDSIEYSDAKILWINLHEKLYRFFQIPNENASYSIMSNRLFSRVY